jgi:hypothetical protein
MNATDWVWCLHCERCYVRGEFRMVRGLRRCPYPGCDGGIVCDGWPWLDYLYGQGVEVDVEKAPVPVRGKVYGVGIIFPGWF